MKSDEFVSPIPVASRERRLESIWRERAERLARPAIGTRGSQDATLFMVLGIGRERYGIDVAQVAEILAPVRATPVPGAAAVFAGVINVHGEIRPVIDLRRWLGIADVEGAPSAELARVVLLRRNGREIGLRVDSVEPIRWIGSGEVRASGSSAHCMGSTRDLLMLLSTEALFAALETGVTT